MEFDRLRRNWENLGRIDPMWAIVTDPDKAGGRWDEREFFATGEVFVRWLGDWIVLHDLLIPRGRALDFGCGIGRLTQPLAPHFDEVVGVDVSQPMIDRARAGNRHGDRVRYVCNPRADLVAFADGSFDYVQSIVVLQHMRPEYSLRYLAELLRVLRRDGLLFFQVATRERVPGTTTRAGAVEQPGEAQIEMYGTTAEQVRAVVTAHGGRVLYEEADDLSGPEWHSAHFAVRRL